MTNETLAQPQTTEDSVSETETNLIWGHCPGCEEPIEKDDQFCGQCGIDIKWAATHCPKCKHERHDVDVFCTQCGATVPE